MLQTGFEQVRGLSMGIKAWVLLIFLLALFIAIVIVEFWQETTEHYYNCYKGRCYRYKASNFSCAGKNTNECSKCPYHKKYEKEIRKNEKHGKA